MRKRSKYRPRQVQSAPLDWVLAGTKRLPDLVDTNITVRSINHLAMQALARGQATRADMNAIANFVNITSALVEYGRGGVYWPEVSAASDAVLAIARKCVSTGHYVATGPQLTAINLALEIHDAQMDVCTVFEIERAMALVRQRTAAGKGRLMYAQEAAA